MLRFQLAKPVTCRPAPLGYLVPALRHSCLVYQSYFKDDERYAPNVSWAARATALGLDANAGKAKRYMWLVDAALGCLGYQVELRREGLWLSPHNYEVQPTTMARGLTGLARLSLLTFTRSEDDFAGNSITNT